MRLQTAPLQLRAFWIPAFAGKTWWRNDRRSSAGRDPGNVNALPDWASSTLGAFWIPAFAGNTWWRNCRRPGAGRDLGNVNALPDWASSTLGAFWIPAFAGKTWWRNDRRSGFLWNDDDGGGSRTASLVYSVLTGRALTVGEWLGDQVLDPASDLALVVAAH